MGIELIGIIIATVIGILSLIAVYPEGRDWIKQQVAKPIITWQKFISKISNLFERIIGRFRNRRLNKKSNSNHSNRQTNQIPDNSRTEKVELPSLDELDGNTVIKIGEITKKLKEMTSYNLPVIGGFTVSSDFSFGYFTWYVTRVDAQNEHADDGIITNEMQRKELTSQGWESFANGAGMGVHIRSWEKGTPALKVAVDLIKANAIIGITLDKIVVRSIDGSKR